ncbi:MAG: hypothetical protein ACK5GN_04685 [Pseudomonadota bacterium]|jgi:hypothetical protein
MSLTNPQDQSGGNRSGTSIASSSQIPDEVLPTRPASWQMSGGLLGISALLEKLTAPRDIQTLGTWRLKFSVAALNKEDWKLLSDALTERGFQDHFKKMLREGSDLKVYSPVMELEQVLEKDVLAFRVFSSIERMCQQKWTGSELNDQLWRSFLERAKESNVVAHGTRGYSSAQGPSAATQPFQLHWALLSIMLDGTINAGDAGLLLPYDKLNPLNAADYGPFYVIFEPGYRNIGKGVFWSGFASDSLSGPSHRDDHQAYIIPEEKFRSFFEKGLNHLAKHGFIPLELAQKELNKLKTYQQWIYGD